ncbi:MAG: hypothetical protein PWQ35_578 [Patescibacteria group bacterium]|nr:hypothetical protein [Patescibacteria group bacterium]
MFNKKKKPIKIEDEIASQVNQDLIVHNMPQSNLSGSDLSYTAAPKTGIIIEDEGKKKYKMVGALIIGLGVILVAVLIFLSYRFFFQPSVGNNEVVPENILEEEVILDNREEEDEFKAPTTTVEVEPEVIVEELTSEEENSNEEEDEYTADFSLVMDSDSDGLTDEEELVFQTNQNLEDSDNDTYFDLDEIRNLYNPSGGGTLEEASYMMRYFSRVANYSFLYPRSWDLSSTNNDYTVIIAAPDNSLLQVSVQPNNRRQTISTWYEATVGEAPVNSEVKGNGWSGIMGADNMNFYLTDNELTNIYVVSYIPTINNRVLYPNIFQLLIDTFKIE